MSEPEEIGPTALGAYADATGDGVDLATRNAIWKVEGDDFTLMIGDANMVTYLSYTEKRVLRGILQRMFKQAKEQESRI